MLVLIRGGGDLASGVAIRLHRAGFRVLITELPQPLVVRRLVSFAEAVYSHQASVEGVNARRVGSPEEVFAVIDRGDIPVLVDPDIQVLSEISPDVLIDGRMTKQAAEYDLGATQLVIGLGPGFIAGENCHAAVETNRGHRLGRVIREGATQSDTGIPEQVLEYTQDRVLRSPVHGVLTVHTEICDHLEPGQLVAEVADTQITAPFGGVLRGILHPGVVVQPGMKIGDVDPRDDPAFCRLVSDKSLAVAGGVLEAVLSIPRIRSAYSSQYAPD